MDQLVDDVVLLDEMARPVGTRSRATVHGAHTPLHLAFSCYLFDAQDNVLLTRRALGKRTWPGVWTNSFCGHPRPGESLPDAVRRHAEHELGATVVDLDVVLPEFRYRAVDASGVVENEVCPVLVARLQGPVTANPDEVMELRWVEPRELGALVALAPWTLSPWAVAQVHEIAQLDDGFPDSLDTERRLVG
ncbi:isopentenyl-diphosphate Delta-isomerase [Pseudactinotalea terrae]|uniref:isopentenyl-diphosphate Delta-isomerase n=1 Tax=Pseudactinotalea terrae TaxID=1743262 RepID=UPI0012E17449